MDPDFSARQGLQKDQAMGRRLACERVEAGSSPALFFALVQTCRDDMGCWPDQVSGQGSGRRKNVASIGAREHFAATRNPAQGAESWGFISAFEIGCSSPAFTGRSTQ